MHAKNLLYECKTGRPFSSFCQRVLLKFGLIAGKLQTMAFNVPLQCTCSGRECVFCAFCTLPLKMIVIIGNTRKMKAAKNSPKTKTAKQGESKRDEACGKNDIFQYSYSPHRCCIFYFFSKKKLLEFSCRKRATTRSVKLAV